MPAGRRSSLRLLVPAVVLLFSGTLAILWQRRERPLSRQRALGQYLYFENCAACHDYTPVGLKQIPPRLDGLFAHPHLPDGATPTSDAAVRQVIIEGKRTMPAFDGRLSATEVDELIAYLHRR